MLDNSSVDRRTPQSLPSEEESPGVAPSDNEGTASLIKPGLNVWRQSRAETVRFLIDGANYFSALKADLERAQHSVWIVGWDFDPGISLDPPGGEQAVKLGDFLRQLVEKNDELVVRILVWAEGPFYSHGLTPYLAEASWANHPRIEMRYDTEHPVRASHHQKIVCIDDAVGFVGGIDLTSERWDSRSHRPDDPARVTSEGEAYSPVHDLEARVTGSAAGLLGDVARRRWLFGTGEEISPASVSLDRREVKSDIADCPVGIALSEPGINGHERRAEPLRLTCDAIAAARNTIYIETQYLASPTVVELLCARLREDDGPEVAIITTKKMHGTIEQWTMGFGRNRSISRLEKADTHGRLRIGYPTVSDGADGECEILIHAKLLIIDDRFIRLGSSNLNHRSQGFDTECDLAIEAETGDHRAAISRLRNDLLAEHLGVSIEEVAEMMEETGGSLCAVIDRFNGGERSLRPFHVDKRHGTSKFWRYGSGIVDPHRPYWPLQRLLVPFRSLGTRLAALKNSLM